MGARNVSSAFTMWAHLPHAQFRLLVGMALQSLDTPSKEGRPARVFFGGEGALVEMLGRSRTQMYRVLDALMESGAIELVGAGRNGNRAVYRLRIDPFEGPAKGPADRDPRAEVQGPGLRDATGSRSTGRSGSRSAGREGSRSSGPLRGTRNHVGDHDQEKTSPPEVPTDREATAGDKADFDYSAASQIVQAAIGIEAATKRIQELATDGTDYVGAMETLLHEVESKKSGGSHA